MVTIEETARYNRNCDSPAVRQQKSVAHHLNVLNRRTITTQNALNDALRRIEQLERFLGVCFTQPEAPCDIAQLDFESPTNL